MVWLSAKGQEHSKVAFRVVLQASLVTLCILWPVIFINKFWALFVVVLILVIATYIGSQKGLLGRLTKNGVFGGIWLTIPLYIYLILNT